MYTNYIFDLYGTLVDIRTDEENMKVWEKLSLFYGYYGALYAPEELKASYRRLVQLRESSMKAGSHDSHEAFPEIQIESVFRQLFADKNVHGDEALAVHAGQFFRVLSTEYVRLYDGVKELLEALGRSGGKIYLLSNAQRIFTAYELRTLDIEKYFNGILISSDYGVKKPDICFFELLLEKYRLNPRECLMIGNDVRCDIEGAQRAGMDTYYIHSNISPECTQPVGATYVQMAVDMARVQKVLGI